MGSDRLLDECVGVVRRCLFFELARSVARQRDGATGSPVAWGQARPSATTSLMMAAGVVEGQAGRRRRRGRAVMVPVSSPGFCRRR